VANYADVLNASEAIRRADLAAAEAEVDQVTNALHRARPEHNGAAEMAAYVEAVEGPAIQALERRRNAAHLRAHERHYDRVAAAGAHWEVFSWEVEVQVFFSSPLPPGQTSRPLFKRDSTVAESPAGVVGRA
jgi:hypothetical protein